MEASREVCFGPPPYLQLWFADGLTVTKFRLLDLSEVEVPIWGEGQHRTWYTYRVHSEVFHIGAQVNSGHYLYFWFSPCRTTLQTQHVR